MLPLPMLGKAACEPITPTRGIGAGTTFATYELVALMARDLQIFAHAYLDTQVSVHVRDVQLVTANRSTASAQLEVPRQWAHLVAIVRGRGMDSAVAKKACIASDKATQVAVSWAVGR